ncbi:DUF6445 family protein [Asticcacaulis solisilvae]|uniref:DUF6445 family protein n=1 Tax=Asticcacaulis solisilvae TaxID=1217274 RepID=UPI003FD826C1
MNPYGPPASARLEIRRIGAEQSPLLIVDDPVAEPLALIDAACRTAFYTPDHTLYPGVNARLPEAYYAAILALLRGPLEGVFGLPAKSYLDYFGFFGLAAPGDLRPIQAVPHYDGADPGLVAMVHYLCPETYEGTAFYRHRATGIETVDPAREAGFAGVAAAELEAGQGMAAYEEIARAGMRFNRLIVYRGNSLHRGLLGGADLSADPLRGRLTANGFVKRKV